VYDEMLRVPLLFQHPVLNSAAVAEPVTLIDLSPTLLDLFGVPTPGDFMGQSLAPALRGDALAFTRPVAVDSGRRKQALFFDDGTKVIRDLMQDTVEVYDLEQDPEELRDLTDSARDVEPHILAMERFFEVHTLKVPGWKPPWRSF
jgi:arylsulfatase A-like enzyme